MKKLQDGIQRMRAGLASPERRRRRFTISAEAARDWALILAGIAVPVILAYAAYVLVPWSWFVGIMIGAGIAAIPLRGIGFGILAIVLGGMFFGPIGMTVGAVIAFAIILR